MVHAAAIAFLFCGMLQFRFQPIDQCRPIQTSRKITFPQGDEKKTQGETSQGIHSYLEIFHQIAYCVNNENTL